MDVGCGNGRNSAFVESKGLECVRVDAAPGCDGKLVTCVLGKESIPIKDKRKIALILCNYVLMFLSKTERARLALDILRLAIKGAIVVLEMYAAKDSECKTDAECEKVLDEFVSLLGKTRDAHTLHQVKLRRIIRLN